MKEYLWEVGFKDKKTGEKHDLRVWATTNDKATHKLVDALFGYDKEYIWNGTAPLYEDNQRIEREIED